MENAHVLITGCSGGGKSTLLDALGQRGFATVREPGRRIIAEERARCGDALPWVDPERFALRAMDMARADLAAAPRERLTFFDRGLIDAAVAYAAATGTDVRMHLGRERSYSRQVYLAPPWPDIFVSDADRKHGMAEAVTEHDRLAEALPALGYDVRILPKAPVAARVAFVLTDLGLA